jgi:hypothetical protein
MGVIGRMSTTVRAETRAQFDEHRLGFAELRPATRLP